MERNNTRNIKEVISDFLRQNKLDTRLKERNLIENWENIVGKTVNRLTKYIYIKDNKLFVHLSSSVAKNELHMIKDDLVRRLNETAGEKIIREIILK